MPGPDAEPDEGASVMIVQIVAMLLAFALPVVVLLLILPEHRQTIIQISIYALFAVSALFAGVGWRKPSYSRSARTYTTWIVFLTVASVSWSVWNSDPDQELSDWALRTSIRAAILVAPFFVGRFIGNQVHKPSKPGRRK